MSISLSSSSRIPRRTVQPFTSVFIDPSSPPVSVPPQNFNNNEGTPKSSRNSIHSRKQSAEREINEGSGRDSSESRDGSLRIPKGGGTLNSIDSLHHLSPHSPLPSSIREQYFKDLEVQKSSPSESLRRLEDSLFICGLQTAGKSLLIRQLKKTFGKKKKKENDGEGKGGDGEAKGENDGPSPTVPSPSLPKSDDALLTKERETLQNQRVINMKFKLTNKQCEIHHFPLDVLQVISEYAYDEESFQSVDRGVLSSSEDIGHGGLSFHFFYFPTAGKVSKYFQSLCGIMGLIFVVNLSDYDRLTVKPSGNSDGEDDGDLSFENSLASAMTLWEEYCKIPLHYFDSNYRLMLLVFTNKTEFHNKITNGDQGFPIEYFPDFPVNNMRKREKSNRKSTEMPLQTPLTASPSTEIPPSQSPPPSTAEYCHDEEFVLNYIKDAFISRHSKFCVHSAHKTTRRDKMKNPSSMDMGREKEKNKGNMMDEEKGGDKLGALFDPPTNPSVAGVSSESEIPPSSSSSSPSSPSPSLQKELSQLYVLDLDVLEDSAMMQIFAALKDFTMLKFLQKTKLNSQREINGGTDRQSGMNNSTKKRGGFFGCCSMDTDTQQ